MKADDLYDKYVGRFLGQVKAFEFIFVPLSLFWVNYTIDSNIWGIIIQK